MTEEVSADDCSVQGALDARIAALAQEWAAAGVQQPGDARPRKPLAQVNQDAVGLLRAGDAIGAAAVLTLLLRACERGRLTHPDIHACYSNRAAALLAMGLHERALQDAEAAARLLEQIPAPQPRHQRSYVQALLRRGRALLGLQRHRQALAVFEQGLQVDPLHEELRVGMEAAGRAVLGELRAGHVTERLALPAPEHLPQPVVSHAASAPLHRIRAEELLPTRLLTPRHAEVDDEMRDMYNFITIETDLRMPKRLLRYMDDSARLEVTQAAIEAAVAAASAGGEVDVRVLLLGSGAGLWGLVALRAGAHHVTCVERWLYLASAAGEVLGRAGVDPDRYHVVYARPTDLRLGKDVPLCCNLLVAVDLVDDSLLGSGLLPSVRHAAQHLLTHSALCIPAAATVWAQAAQVCVPRSVAGLDLSALDQHRYWPSQSLGAPLAPGLLTPLSSPLEAWHFDLMGTPGNAEAKHLDLELTVDGNFNGVAFWLELRLFGEMRLVTHVPAPAAQQGAEARAGPGAAACAGSCNSCIIQGGDGVGGSSSSGNAAPGAESRYTTGATTVEVPCCVAAAAKGQHERADSPAAAASPPSGGTGSVGGAQGPTKSAGLVEEGAGQAVAAAVVVEARAEAPAKATITMLQQVHDQSGGSSSSSSNSRTNSSLVVSGGGEQHLRHPPVGVARSLQAAVHWLPGPIRVRAGQRLPLLACHNTVAMRFEVEEAEYGWLVQPDISLPPQTWAMAADTQRVDAYRAAAERAVARRKAKGERVVALDLGTGCGVLAAAVAAAGADSVMAVEVHPLLAKVARRNAAANGLGTKVAVVQGDACRLQRGRDVPRSGANMLVFDLFDGGLLGHRALTQIEGAKRSLLSTAGACDIIPSAAEVWVVGVDLLSRKVCGHDMSPLNKYRWDDTYETVRLHDLPYRQLTRPAKAFTFNFAGDAAMGAYPSSASLQLEVVRPGVFNAVAFWFDLRLDEHATLSNAPTGMALYPGCDSVGTAAENAAPAAAEVALSAQASAAPPQEGEAIQKNSSGSSSNDNNASCSVAQQVPPGAACGLGEDRQGASSSGGGGGRHSASHHWGQALQYLDCAVPVMPGRGSVTLVGTRQANGLRFRLRAGVGAPVPRPPWKVEWGGGVSIENPHVQRARYCQLLVAEWLQRLPRGRGNPISAELSVMARHCGSLLLDPASLAAISHRLVLMERLYGRTAKGGAGLGDDAGEVLEAVSGRSGGEEAVAEGSVGGDAMDGGGAAGNGGSSACSYDFGVPEERVGLVRPEDVTSASGLPVVWG